MNYPLSNMPQHMVRNAFEKAMRNVKPRLIAKVSADIDTEGRKETPDINLLTRLRTLLDGLNGPSYIGTLA